MTSVQNVPAARRIKPMRHATLTLLLSCSLSVTVFAGEKDRGQGAALTAGEAAQGFVPMFDGKSLDWLGRLERQHQTATTSRTAN